MKQIYILITFIFLSSLQLLSAQNKLAMIGATDVKMRAAASTSSDLVGKFQLGDLAEILDQSSSSEKIPGIADGENCNEFHWYKLRIGNSTGWVFGAFVFELVNQLKVYNPGSEITKGHICNFYARASGGDMCYGDNFLAFLEGEDANKSAKVRLIKLDKVRKGDYRKMPGLDFDMKMIQAVDAKDKIVLITGGYAPGDYAEVRVLELSKINDYYFAKQAYYNSTHYTP